MTDRPDLEQIKQRAEAAVEGRWEIQPLNMDKYPESEFGYPQRIVANDDGLVLIAECYQEPMTPHLARFIAHARTDIPALLAAIDELTAQREAVLALHKQIPAPNLEEYECCECLAPWPCLTVRALT